MIKGFFMADGGAGSAARVDRPSIWRWLEVHPRTAILGIVGSFVGTFLGQAVGLYKAGEYGGWIAAIAGAMILLWIYGRVVKNKAAGPQA